MFSYNELRTLWVQYFVCSAILNDSLITGKCVETGLMSLPEPNPFMTPSAGGENTQSTTLVSQSYQAPEVTIKAGSDRRLPWFKDIEVLFQFCNNNNSPLKFPSSSCIFWFCITHVRWYSENKDVSVDLQGHLKWVALIYINLQHFYFDRLIEPFFITW